MAVRLDANPPVYSPGSSAAAVPSNTVAPETHVDQSPPSPSDGGWVARPPVARPQPPQSPQSPQSPLPTCGPQAAVQAAATEAAAPTTGWNDRGDRPVTLPGPKIDGGTPSPLDGYVFLPVLGETGTAKLAWSLPTSNHPAVKLTGFTLYYSNHGSGTERVDGSQNRLSVTINNPLAREGSVQNLMTGYPWCFAIKANYVAKTAGTYTRPDGVQVNFRAGDRLQSDYNSNLNVCKDF
jgi:hypothetical protein